MNFNVENIIRELKNTLLELGVGYFSSIICFTCALASFVIAGKIKPESPHWLTAVSVSVIVLVIALLLALLGYKNRKYIKTLKSYGDANLSNLKSIIEKNSAKDKELRTATFFRSHNQHTTSKDSSSNSSENQVSYNDFSTFCDELTQKGELKQYIIKFINNDKDAESFINFIEELKKHEKQLNKKLRYQIKILFTEGEFEIPLPSSLMLYLPVQFSQSYYSSGSFYFIDINLSTKSDIEIAMQLWNEIWSNPKFKTLYNGIDSNIGINYEAEKKLHDYLENYKKGTFYDLAELKELCEKFYESNILNDNQISSIVLFGSYAHNLNCVPNDIDIVIVVNDFSTTVRECFNIELLKRIAKKYKFNFKINGLTEFSKGYHVDIDFCVDSLLFINKQDPISLIDIASQPHFLLFSKDQSDPYESLKEVNIPYHKKLSRILSSLEYIQVNMEKIKSKNEYSLILKQLEHSLYHYTNTSNISLESALEVSKINYPYLIPFIENLSLAKHFQKQYPFSKVENIFIEFKQQITPKIEEKLTSQSS